MTFRLIEDAGLFPSPSRQFFEQSFLDALIDDSDSKTEIELISYLPKNKRIKSLPIVEKYRDTQVNYIWTSRKNPFEMFAANRRVRKLITKWIKETQGEERIILTYAANPILLAFCPAHKVDIKIVTICSEIPMYRNMTEGNKLVNKLKKKVFSYYNDKMDGFIYMSKYMDEVCNPKKKPYVVVEGMAKVVPFEQYENDRSESEVIFYAGGLHVENGIDILLQAFKTLKDRSIQLQLCGIGNAVDMIKEYAINDDRIRYLGSLPNSEVKKLEKEATLLINPRKPNERLTRYSFPSKTFEYFLSGTACLITRLDGIPDEFYDYCYICDVSSAEALARDMSDTLAIPKPERRKKAADAYRFISTQKSPAEQTRKILMFLKSII